MTEAALFYDAAKTGLGDAFLDDIQHAIDTDRERPISELQSRTASDERFFAASHSAPFYASDESEIIVVAVAHQRRRPYYWKGRV